MEKKKITEKRDREREKDERGMRKRKYLFYFYMCHPHAAIYTIGKILIVLLYQCQHKSLFYIQANVM